MFPNKSLGTGGALRKQDTIGNENPDSVTFFSSELVELIQLRAKLLFFFLKDLLSSHSCCAARVSAGKHPRGSSTCILFGSWFGGVFFFFLPLYLCLSTPCSSGVASCLSGRFLPLASHRFICYLTKLVRFWAWTVLLLSRVRLQSLGLLCCWQTQSNSSIKIIGLP